jgi:hypothetical protein
VSKMINLSFGVLAESEIIVLVITVATNRIIKG